MWQCGGSGWRFDFYIAEREPIVLTCIFQSGDSTAVHVPKELAFMVIRPIERRTLAGLAEALALFPTTFMAEGRERDWVTGQSFGGSV